MTNLFVIDERKREQKALEPGMTQGTILVVDDQESIRKLVCLHLRKEGYEVFTACDGREGLALAMRHRPDIIISDLMMPGLDGMELCRLVKKQKELRETFFIMLTAKSRIEDKLRGFGSGADDYMVKPFNHHELAARVASAMRIRLLQKELMTLNRIKDEFLGMAAHDMRTPLTVIKGWCDLFLQHLLGTLTGEQVEAIDGINQQAALMLHLINDLLDVAKIDAGKVQLAPAFHNISDIVAEYLRTQSLVAAKKHITLVNQVRSDLPPAWIDAERVGQILGNLLSNAFKFSPENATVAVSAVSNGDFIEVSVSDTGVGIPPEDVEKMFEKFAQVSSRAPRGEKGTGLGLAIVKKLVEMHGGRVWAKSKVGEGSTFSFSLPTKKTTPGDMEQVEQEGNLQGVGSPSN
jgi:signal transduction histidine kinase